MKGSSIIQAATVPDCSGRDAKGGSTAAGT
jgi:hypothetical protein